MGTGKPTFIFADNQSAMAPAIISAAARKKAVNRDDEESAAGTGHRAAAMVAADIWRSKLRESRPRSKGGSRACIGGRPERLKPGRGKAKGRQAMATERNDEEPTFVTDFAGEPGEAIALSPLVRRVLAPNPSAFTFRGTNGYIVGRGHVVIIDPGPEDAAHAARLLDILRGETVSHIVVTHTHRDHSPAARAIAKATGAPIVGCAPYAPKIEAGEEIRLDASHDREHAPDLIMREGDFISGPGWTLRALETPGHASNHLCFSLAEENALFSGDHVMGWSTSIVSPPDGMMSDYMASLEKLRIRDDAIYWPGHGDAVRNPQRFVRGLINHRRHRESAILKRLSEGDRTIAEIVPVLYAGVPKALHPAASQSVLAHLIDLVGRGVVKTDGEARIDGEYRIA